MHRECVRTHNDETRILRDEFCKNVVIVVVLGRHRYCSASVVSRSGIAFRG